MTNELKTAILIPTLNAGDLWSMVLKSINEQNFSFDNKIIIDSGSSDETVNLAKSFGFTVYEIEKSDFNHGATRQQLVNYCENADLCVFLTQDAILSSPHSIQKIIEVFEDPEVGVAYGRQLPHLNALPLEIHSRLFNYPPKSETLSMDDANRLGFKVFFSSNAFSAYRKIALDAVGGFPLDSIMGEDAIVAAKMLLAGYKKAYVAEAIVNHSHNYTLKEEFRRYFDTRVFHEQNKWLTAKFGKPTGEGFRFLNSEIKYVLKNDTKSIFKSVSSLWVKWLGYKSGKYYNVISKNLLKKISMHRNFWK